MSARRVLMVLGLAGAAFVVVLPPSWRSSVLAGWAAGMVLELALAALRDGARQGRAPLLGATLVGFLLRLVLLTAGTVAAAVTGTGRAEGFLLAAAAAALCGLAIGFSFLLASPRRRPAQPRPTPDDPST